MNWYKKAMDDWKKLDEHMSNYAGVSVYIVDGNYVRNNFDVDFVLGGHGYVYDYVPKDEIWIENVPSTEDQYFNLRHEIYERDLMLEKGIEYDKAHEEAANFEKGLREKLKRGY